MRVKEVLGVSSLLTKKRLKEVFGLCNSATD